MKPLGGEGWVWDETTVLGDCPIVAPRSLNRRFDRRC